MEDFLDLKALEYYPVLILLSFLLVLILFL